MFQEIRQLPEWRALERAAQRAARGPHTGIRAGVRRPSSLCPADGPGDAAAPIFLLSAGWRSGSTLMQRLILFDSRVFPWGEPYQESERDALVINFEDLSQGHVSLASPEAHLDIRIDHAVLATRLDGADPAAKAPTLGRLRALLPRRAESLGYGW